jgi:hypothetical protein
VNKWVVFILRPIAAAVIGLALFRGLRWRDSQLTKYRHYTHHAAAGVLSEMAWLQQLCSHNPSSWNNRALSLMVTGGQPTSERNYVPQAINLWPKTPKPCRPRLS